jgi:hypothetical protein
MRRRYGHRAVVTTAIDGINQAIAICLTANT